jgi:hypothetical protein
VNDRLAGLAVRVGSDAEVTVKVTGTVFGLFETPADVMVTDPEYEPGASPEGLTDTLTLPGVVPLAGVAESQVAEVAVV